MMQRLNPACRPAGRRITVGAVAAAGWALLALLPGCTGVAAPLAPPVSYAPPPAYVQPGYAAPAAYAGTCYAGAYTCQMPVSGPVGASCSCPGIGAPSYGTIR